MISLDYNCNFGNKQVCEFKFIEFLDLIDGV
jgi:hypothetical protein